MLEPILHLLLGLEVIPLLYEVVDPLQNLLRYLIRFTQFERIPVWVLFKLVPDRLLHTVQALVYELLEVAMVQVESIRVPGVVDLIFEAVVNLKVEYLLNVQQHLDDPILTDCPFAELGLKAQLARLVVH